VCLVLNLGFALWLVQEYQEAGLAVANTLSATINLGLLTYALRRKLSRLGLAGFRRTLLVLVPAAIIAGITAALLWGMWERKLGHATLPLRLGAVFVPGGVAVLLYWLAALGLGVPAAREMTGLLLRRRHRHEP